MMNEDLIPFEVWKDIPEDTKYRYQASNIGRISHLYEDGTRKILSECYVNSMHGWVTCLVMADGTYKKYHTVSLVARAWLGKRDNNYQAIHKNGISKDHRISNIKYVKRSEIGSIANRSKRKAVFKIDATGNVVEVYKSARECADKNNLCYSAIKMQCNGRNKSILATDNHAYCYEDDFRRYKRILKELKRFNA